MEKIRYYDEAISKFYRNQEINSYPLSSLDIYSQHFDKVCQSLQDISNLSDLAKKEKWGYDLPFKDEILGKEHVVVVTDPQLNIVYASQNIYSMNGYRPEEILGKKPKMFQGEKTCMDTARTISMAVRNLESFEATITNYRKNGSTYNCWIQGAPVFDTQGKVVNFIAFEKDEAKLCLGSLETTVFNFGYAKRIHHSFNLYWHGGKAYEHIAYVQKSFFTGNLVDIFNGLVR